MGLQIIVCIKSVIIHAPTQQVVRSWATCALNPFDRPALELALRMKEAWGGVVTAVSMGPESCMFTLHEAMAIGVDQAVLVSDPALAKSDTLATSTALAAALGKLRPFDLVLFGTRAADSDTGQVGPQTAVLLDLPMVTGVHAVEVKKTGLLVERRADGYLDRFELDFPAALTVHPSAVQPRDASLPGIEIAFEERKVKRRNLPDLGLSAEQVGDAGSGTKVLSMSRAEKRRECTFLSGSAEDQADRLIQELLKSGLLR